jgi:excinuclease ABC subunit C
LHTVQQKQFMESGQAKDVDIVAVAEMNGMLCVNLAMVRGGRHLGDKNFFPQNSDGLSAADALEAFLAQHYLSREVPHLILTSLEVPAAPLEELLGSQAGHNVEIRHSSSGERRQWLDMSLNNALLALQQQASQQAGQRGRLVALQEALSLPALLRMECFDISHTMGEATIASCVVYENLAMRNTEYRRYNIPVASEHHPEGITAGDDYAAMRFALMKRYQKLQAGAGKRPDLILIDGGAGQLAVAVAVMAELGLSDIPLLGVAKGVERKPGLEQLLRPGQEKPLQLPQDSPALHLIQQIRDEAHRFAISGHRAKRGKARTASVLEEVGGVGERRRRNLLARFGGLQGVRSATVEELAQVEGISRALAEKIYQQLH